MESPQFDLTLRRFERYLGDFPGEVSIGPASAPAIRIARSALTNAGTVSVRVVDFSRGGLGFKAGVYFPGGCSVHVKMTLEGTPVFRFDAPLIVRRVTMLDGKPTYYIGAAFDPADAALDAKVARVIDELKARGATVEMGVRHAG
jgi:hypothetical protein